MRSDLSTNADAVSGEVSVFGSVTASYSLLTQILPLMRETYPGLELKLRTGDQADGVERVLRGDEDSAIVARPDVMPRKLSFLSLRQTPLLLIGPRTPSALSRQLDGLLASDDPMNWTDLSMVLAERGLARERLLGWYDEVSLVPSIYAQVAGHEAVVSMISLGLGLAVVPELVIQHSPKQETIRVLPWLTDLKPFELGLCTLDERGTDPLIQAFWRCAGLSYPQP